MIWQMADLCSAQGFVEAFWAKLKNDPEFELIRLSDGNSGERTVAFD